MNTTQVSIEVSNREVAEELVAKLAAAGFDAFEEKETELVAFIREENFDRVVLENILSEYGVKHTRSTIEEQNWNALWESNFKPVMVDDFCLIRAEFHAQDERAQHEIIITPKMSFGTGHHATTFMMVSNMEKIDFSGKKVADFGTGTGLLAILAEKLGSHSVWAIDNDDWSIENARENIEKNSCSRILLEKQENFSAQTRFDVILANINKNVLIANADSLVSSLAPKGNLLLSGLLNIDYADIVSVFGEKGLKLSTTSHKAQWICLLFINE